MAGATCPDCGHLVEVGDEVFGVQDFYQDGGKWTGITCGSCGNKFSVNTGADIGLF
jgi:transcription elongation factor Elf1